MQVTPSQWGNSLGIRLPKEVAQQAGIEKGKPVEIWVEGKKVMIAPSEKRGHSGMTVKELLAGMTPELAQEDAAEINWGPDVGREIIDD